ncbi:Hypothetical predicted protein [Mytilus galloprovincialis]|uniref:Uncharacterized protein n=1 Tax=Mytilus galloprovincialis TaxID=29158 RepID=A0A8B6CCI9_MYTGA|nr:Hypothetical predicted protein [Mytilus galloprovincialis]
MTENHSDDEDTLLLNEPTVHASGAKSSSVPQISDQTFELFTSYFDNIVSELQKLQKRTSAEDFVSTNLISGLILKINRRNKLIQIADKTPAGWSTVQEYESDDLASDSEDEKPSRQAESRALKTIKEKKNPWKTVLKTVRHRCETYQLY